MRNLIQSLSAGIVLSLVSTAAYAEGISTHVLDIANGVGKADVPVTLSIQDGENSWSDLGSAMTEENGRVETFGEDVTVQQGVYKLTFDMLETGETFFPEIDVVFNVEDLEEHYHVPIVVSPYGYSTYRGN